VNIIQWNSANYSTIILFAGNRFEIIRTKIDNYFLNLKELQIIKQNNPKHIADYKEELKNGAQVIDPYE
jgi:hypothetical protein